MEAGAIQTAKRKPWLSYFGLLVMPALQQDNWNVTYGQLIVIEIAFNQNLDIPASEPWPEAPRLNYTISAPCFLLRSGKTCAALLALGSQNTTLGLYIVLNWHVLLKDPDIQPLKQFYFVVKTFDVWEQGPKVNNSGAIHSQKFHIDLRAVMVLLTLLSILLEPITRL